jgi:HAMP domain-containing protein
MTLLVKFNVAMLAAFLAGLGLAGLFVNTVAQREARRSVMAQAALIMSAADATIHYTDTQVTPLLSDEMKTQFLPQSIPFFVAQQTIQQLALASLPDDVYRQPALNPTNPADKPTSWEADIIKTLMAQPVLDHLVTERATKTGMILSYSKPIRVTSESCLECHSNPAVAPSTMLDTYGRDHGFNWKLGDTVGAQIVSMPESVPLRLARSNLYAIMVGLTSVFAVMLIMLNLLLHFFIIVPVRRMAKLANEISLGKMDAPEFMFRSRDEIGSLATSFNRMRRSLITAMGMLGG